MVSPSERVDSPVSVLRCSEHERRKPDQYGFQCNLTGVKEPNFVSDALTNHEWADAMEAEIDSLHDNDVWELVELPKDRKPVGS